MIASLAVLLAALSPLLPSALGTANPAAAEPAAPVPAYLQNLPRDSFRFDLESTVLPPTGLVIHGAVDDFESVHGMWCINLESETSRKTVFRDRAEQEVDAAGRHVLRHAAPYLTEHAYTNPAPFSANGVVFKCYSRASRNAYFQNVALRSDTRPWTPPGKLVIPPRGHGLPTYASIVPGPAQKSRKNAKLLPPALVRWPTCAHDYNNCPYSDCFTCLHAWLFYGTPGYRDLAVLLDVATGRNEADFVHRQCKVAFVQYYSLMEPPGAEALDKMRCSRALRCEDWINFNTAASDFSNIEHCTCGATSPYAEEEGFAEVCSPADTWV